MHRRLARYHLPSLNRIVYRILNACGHRDSAKSYMKAKEYKLLFKRNITVFQNLTYITMLQLFVIITPLITYPYLIRILGKELYGWVITAQIFASYCSVFIDFGFKVSSARHVSIWRYDKEKLSEIISSILFLQCLIWVVCMIIYVSVIYSIPSYKNHIWLFLFSFGLTFNELLFPQYYFQGIEKMKYITLCNVVIRLVFVILIFFFIKSADDYIYVPLLYSIGYFIGGAGALYIIFVKHGIHFRIPTNHSLLYYLKDASPIFFTDIICTIKDKLNYLLLGGFVGMKEVTIYDLGSKFTNVLVKPANILATVLFPKMAKERNLLIFNKTALFLVIGITILVGLLNIFLPQVVNFFLAENINLTSIRLYSIAPIVLGLSSFISSNLIIALGYNKYMLYSILMTTFAYLLLLGLFYGVGYLNSINAFIVLTVTSYIVELAYRLILAKKIQKKEK